MQCPSHLERHYAATATLQRTIWRFQRSVSMAFFSEYPRRSKWFHHFHRKELGIHRTLSVSFQEISGFSLSQRKLPATYLVYHKSHPDSFENICYDASFLLRFQHFGALQNLEPAGAMATFISTKLVDSWVELDGRWMYFDFVQHISLSFAKWPGYSSGRASLRLADSAGTSLCWAHAKRGASGSHPALASDVSDQSLDKITKVTPSAEDFWEWAFREFLRMIVEVDWSRQSSHPRISEGMRYTKSALSLSAASRSQKKNIIYQYHHSDDSEKVEDAEDKKRKVLRSATARK